MSENRLTPWKPRSLATAVSSGLVAALLALVFALTAAQAAQPTDPVLQHPGFAVFAAQHPRDWEQRVHPRVRPIINWQRAVGSHAVILGWADEEGNPRYPNPRVVIHVGRWDGNDLFALGLPRTYNGKPVVINDIKDIPRAAAWCDKLRPAQGGLAMGNDRVGVAGTLGGAVIGQGWPTNANWKYAVGSQHAMADGAGNQAGDRISQPPAGCQGSEQLGSLIDIPAHLRIRYNNPDNSNTQDSALAPLVNHDALSAQVIGVGVPAG